MTYQSAQLQLRNQNARKENRGSLDQLIIEANILNSKEQGWVYNTHSHIKTGKILQKNQKYKQALS